MWWMMLGAALAGTCETISMAEAVAVDAPAVIVVGTRHGTQPDLARAHRLVQKLSADGDVTLALQAIRPRYQPVLDDYANGKMDATDLPGLLNWDTEWGFAYTPYERLVTAALDDVKVVAAGVTQTQRPPDATAPTPPGYIRLFRDAIGEHTMPMDVEAHFVKGVAWLDHQVAEAAVSSWSGEGFLVIVADRTQVEGGLGIPWQVAHLTDAPVSTVITHKGGEPPCFDGDRFLR